MLPEDLKVEIARGLRRPRDAAGKIIPGPGEPLEDFIRRIVELAYQRGREDERKECAELEGAARAVIARWDTPAWKESEPTAHVIALLRAAIEARGRKA